MQNKDKGSDIEDALGQGEGQRVFVNVISESAQKGFETAGLDKCEALICLISVEIGKTPCRKNLRNPDPGSKAITIKMRAAIHKFLHCPDTLLGTHGTYIILFGPHNSKR